MNAKERYNKIINTIEELAKGQSIDGVIVPYTDHEISDRAFKAACCSTMNDNSKNALFSFLNNCTVINYIKERKMVAVYKMICDSKVWNKNLIWNAIEMAGMSDSQGFSKKFKRYFEISPKKAFENKESAVFPEIRDWDFISTEGRNMFVKFNEIDMVDNKFGISKEKFMAAQVAANLQSFYNLNDYESEIAFKLAEDKELPIEDTFEYIYNYVWSFMDENSPERDKRLEKDLLKQEVIHMYFNCCMTFNEIRMVLVALKKCKLPRDLKDTDRLYLLGFQKYSKHVIDYQRYNSGSFRLSSNIMTNIAYEEIYTTYQDIAEPSDTDKVFLEFVVACTKYSVEDAINYARYMAFEHLNSQRYNEDESEELESELYRLRYNEIEDERISNEDDYEPDFDDLDNFEKDYLYNDELELYTEYYNALEELEENFTFEDFNLFCDELDNEDYTEDDTEDKLKSKRRLVGFTSLDDEEEVNTRIEEFGNCDDELPFI
jgi:AraC-like DNA-binding protein